MQPNTAKPPASAVGSFTPIEILAVAPLFALVGWLAYGAWLLDRGAQDHDQAKREGKS